MHHEEFRDSKDKRSHASNYFGSISSTGKGYRGISHSQSSRTIHITIHVFKLHNMDRTPTIQVKFLKVILKGLLVMIDFLVILVLQSK